MSVTSRRRRFESGSTRWRRAFTLVEMLIAMALTLILVYAIAEFYAYVGNTVKDGRAMIEMGSLLRVATTRLKADLELVTVPVVPWAEDGSALGYFTIREGNRSDIDANGNSVLDATEDTDGNSVNDYQQFNISSLLGDTDDLIAFTIRAKDEPFTGRHYNSGTGNYDTVTSNLAEVIWFTGFSDVDFSGAWTADEPRFLYRRLLLIRPDLLQNLTMPATALPTDNIFHHNDISAHFVSGTTWQANQLHELSRRENRFAHTSGAVNFPNALALDPDLFTGLTAYTLYALNGTYFGEDRVLSNLLAFDIRVFDPTAPLIADNTEPADTDGDPTNDASGTLQPGDAGWANAISLNYHLPSPVGYGAYVDLYYSRYATPPTASTFSGAPFYTGPVAGQVAYWNTIGGTYDTWATSYERDGLNQDFLDDGVLNINLPPFDEGTDGFDNDNANGVDDPGERETSPPYPVPLRGIQIKIRMYEPSTRQVRQATVGWDFLQE